MIVVSDTSPVSNLLQIGEMDLLRKLFSRIVIPQAVFDEVCRIEVHRLALNELDWVEVVPLSDNRLRDQLIAELDDGEAEAIALAIQINADYVLIDESKAREVAALRGLKTIGLLGVLIKAKKEGHISSIRGYIDRLVTDAKFWLNPRLIKDVLELVGED